MKSLKSVLRRILRNYCLTPNTIRYVVEYRIVKRAFEALPKGGVLLDAGAGSGQMSLKLWDDGYCGRLIGVEPFQKNYDLLVANYARCANSEALCASLENIPVADQSVDYVLSTQVFEHIKEHEKAAAEVVRTLKVGGHLIISVPHPPERMPNDDHVRPGYTREDLEVLFGQLGMECINTEYYLTLPTFCRLLAAMELPFHGAFLPISWADKEKSMTSEERKNNHPGAILCVFKKKATPA